MRYTNPNEEKLSYKLILSVLIIFMMASLLGAMGCFISLLFSAYSLKLLICSLYFTIAFLFSYNQCQNY